MRPVCKSLRRKLASLSSAQFVAPTLLAYLDNISGVGPLEAMIGSLDKLRELESGIGLHFDDFLKNYFYMPLRVKKSI